MLFVLSGGIQTGKTRWLCGVIDSIADSGITPFGVLAPGIWRKVGDASDMASSESDGIGASEAHLESAGNYNVVSISAGYSCAEVEAIDWKAVPAKTPDENGFEKLGICNVVLPQKEALLFALRRDAAIACGRLVEGAQSERAKLGWHIFDDSIKKVDDRFKQALEQGILDYCNSSSREGSEGSSAEKAFLLVDELGRLELLRGEGLTSAMALLKQGATDECPHALVVVREGLSFYAEEALTDAWNGCLHIYPDQDGKNVLMSTVCLN